MRVVILCETEMTDVARIVAGTLQGTEHHHRNRPAKRMALDFRKELRHVASVRYVAALYADGCEICPEHLHSLRIRRLVETRKYPDSPSPKLLRDGLIRRHHALLHHLVGFIIGTLLNAGHLTVVVKEDLRFRDLKIQRPSGETQFPQLLRKLMYGKDGGNLTLRDSGIVAPFYESHHLFVGEAHLRTDY